MKLDNPYSSSHVYQSNGIDIDSTRKRFVYRHFVAGATLGGILPIIYFCFVAWSVLAANNDDVESVKSGTSIVAASICVLAGCPILSIGFGLIGILIAEIRDKSRGKLSDH